MNYFFVIYFVSFCAFGFCAVEFKNCGSDKGSFSKISVSDCEGTTKNYCVLKKQTNATISIDFTPSVENIDKVEAVVHGTVAGLTIPFALPQPDGCVDSGVECPIVKDKEYKYSATLPILKVYPKVRVEVKWELKDGEGKDIVCVLIPAKIE